MVCIYCGGKTQVINSRLQKRINQIWRRRRCLACKSIFTTHESPDLTTGLVVQYNTQAFRPFLRDTLFLSVYDALKHRREPQEDAMALTATIVAFILKEATEGVVARNKIVAIAAATLERFDKAAATMYRAYHKL